MAAQFFDTHPEAIEQALCFGWIDSIGRRIDAPSYQVRFTPRRPGSVWSSLNIAKITELIERGQMTPAGQQVFAAREPDRVASYSYEQPADAVLTDEQATRFQAAPDAWQWFSAQAPSCRPAAVHRVVSAKRARPASGVSTSCQQPRRRDKRCHRWLPADAARVVQLSPIELGRLGHPIR